MPAASHDLAVEAGATFSTSFTYQDFAGAPIPLTGYVAVFQARRKLADAVPVITKTLAISASSTMTVYLTAVETAALVKGGLAYGIELHSPDPDLVIRLVQGKLTVSPEVVRLPTP